MNTSEQRAPRATATALRPWIVATAAFALAACPSLLGACSDDRKATTESVAAAEAPVALKLPVTVVIGASVSDGFDCTDPRVPPAAPKPGAPVDPASAFGNLGGGAARIRLAELLGAMLDQPPPAAFTSSFYFMNPSGIAEQQLKSAVEARPALVFAVDYLFWHAYGAMPDDKREAFLQRGLDRLDKLLGTSPRAALAKEGSTPDAPVLVVADLPDMSHAVGKMLMPAQMPEKPTLARLNEKLAAWVKDRPRVVMISLSQTVEQAMKSGTLELGGSTYSGAAARDLLTWDGLHATPSGVVAMLNEAILRLQSRGVLERRASWTRDAKMVVERVAVSRGGLKSGSGSPAQGDTPAASPP